MAKKDIIFGDEARQKLKDGVDKIANAVTTTLGPKGRNVALDTAWGRPKVVHDGVTVARHIELKDKWEDMGAQIAREASENTNDKAGDGTSTSILLAQAIVNEGFRNISSGANPMTLKRELQEAANLIVKEIEKMAKPVATKEEKTQVATISAQDKEIGALISEAMEKVGDDGVITVEEGGLNIELEYKAGMQFDRGFANPYFVTNPGRMEAVVNEPRILFVDYRLENMQELVTVLNEVAKVTKKVVIIAEDFDTESLGMLVLNKLQGGMQVLAVKAPGVGTRRSERLEDMAILTGGTVISKGTGRDLLSVEIEDLGYAEKVQSTKDETVIIGGGGDKKSIKTRVKNIKELLKETATEFDELKLRERMASIAGGVAVINVGAATESELKEKKLRVEDAVHATKAAVQEGIVPGGGVALFRARNILSLDDTLGFKIIFSSLKAPITKIIENAGFEAGEIIAGIKEDKGFDVMTMEYVDMMKEGIVDPAKVVRLALQNAVSVAGLILTMECLVYDTDEEIEKKRPVPKLPGSSR